MFKNLTVFKVGKLSANNLPAFVPCEPRQALSVGLVPPREDGELLECGMLRVRIERKSVPAQTAKRWVDKRAALYEREHGRKPGKKLRQEMKEQAVFELLAHAFPKQSDVWVTLIGDLLLVGSTASADVDVVLSLLREFEPAVLDWAPPPLTSWLVDPGSRPSWMLAVGRKAVLEGGDRGRVAISGVSLESGTVTQHVTEGHMSVAEMAVGYGESVSFTLTDTLELKGIELVNVASDKEDALEAEAFLWRAHLTPLLRDLQESCDAA